MVSRWGQEEMGAKTKDQDQRVMASMNDSPQQSYATKSNSVLKDHPIERKHSHWEHTSNKSYIK